MKKSTKVQFFINLKKHFGWQKDETEDKTPDSEEIQKKPYK